MLAIALLLAAPPTLEIGDPWTFDVQTLATDQNEGCAVGDIDGDGDVDIAAGRSWYENPGSREGDWAVRPVRAIKDWNGYVESNGDQLVDVNQDGRLDVVSVPFVGTVVRWYENPGPDGLAAGRLWKEHVLKDTGLSQNETVLLHDIDGDGRDEWVTNSWKKDNALVAWSFTSTEDGPTLRKHVIGESGNGHGMAFGDINGDGREDILVGEGWYERPADEEVLSQQWAFHHDWPGGHFSVPMFVGDRTGDGVPDLLWGTPHDFGLILWQGEGAHADGKLDFSSVTLDPSLAQLHALHWADLNGDGRDELITGRRFRAHNGKDPGSATPLVVVAYEFVGPKLVRHTVADGVGIGLQIRTVDLDGDDAPEVIVAGKDGTQILWNRVPESTPTKPAL